MRNDVTSEEPRRFKGARCRRIRWRRWGLRSVPNEIVTAESPSGWARRGRASSGEWGNGHAGLLESRPQCAKNRRRVGIVAMNAQRLGRNAELGTVVRRDGLSLYEHDRALDGAFYVVNYCVRLRAWNERAIRLVGSVDECFAREGNSLANRGAPHLAARESEQRSDASTRRTLDDGSRLPPADPSRLYKRAVRLNREPWRARREHVRRARIWIQRRGAISLGGRTSYRRPKRGSPERRVSPSSPPRLRGQTVSRHGGRRAVEAVRFADDTRSSSLRPRGGSGRSASPRSALYIVRGKELFLAALFPPLTGFASTISQSSWSSSKPPRVTFGRSFSRTTTGVSQ